MDWIRMNRDLINLITAITSLAGLLLALWKAWEHRTRLVITPGWAIQTSEGNIAFVKSLSQIQSGQAQAAINMCNRCSKPVTIVDVGYKLQGKRFLSATPLATAPKDEWPLRLPPYDSALVAVEPPAKRFNGRILKVYAKTSTGKLVYGAGKGLGELRET